MLRLRDFQASVCETDISKQKYKHVKKHHKSSRIDFISIMALKVETFVYQYLKAHFENPKLLNKFCEKANFDPESNTDENELPNFSELMQIPSLEENKENSGKKRKLEDDNAEDDFIKKPKFDKNQAECFKCGKVGHMKNECTENKQDFNKSSNGSGCFKCGQEGHFSRECPNKSQNQQEYHCYNCGQNGHFSRECPEKAAGRKCYNW